MSQPPGPNHPYAPPAHAPQGAPGGGVIDALVPTNPLAAVSCWVGIFSVLICGAGVLLGPIAVVTGLVSLKKGAIVQQSGYGKATSTLRSWIGIVSGTIGTLVSLGFIINMLLNKH
jgi:hypothetical protein